MPSDQKIAELLVSEFVDAVNNKSKTTDILSKYYPYAEKISFVQSEIVKIFKDGKIDDDEKLQLENAILPLIKKITEQI